MKLHPKPVRCWAVYTPRGRCRLVAIWPVVARNHALKGVDTIIPGTFTPDPPKGARRGKAKK